MIKGYVTSMSSGNFSRAYFSAADHKFYCLAPQAKHDFFLFFIPVKKHEYNVPIRIHKCGYI